MYRICTTLQDAGYQVTLLGWKKFRKNEAYDPNFKTRTMKPLFKSGKWFYIETNIRLYFKLLFTRFDALCAIDLDTLLPARAIARLKHKKLIYDSHELFTEQHEIATRPRIKRMWERIEKKGFKNLKYAYTVSASIADYYRNQYGIPFEVIRNLDYQRNAEKQTSTEKRIIYVGAVNAGRGLKESILAMHKVRAKLYICGYGDLLTDLKNFTKEQGLENKIIFTGTQTPEQLRLQLSKAHIGLLLLEDISKSYYYTLANKFFDYVQAELPQITIPFPEYKKLNEEYEVSAFCNLDSEEIARNINKLLTDADYYERLEKNCRTAKTLWNWENESVKLKAFYQQVFNDRTQ